MTGTKNPYSTVFWNDIENDEKLKTCSLAAAGLWLRHMLPMAARSPEPGVVLSGKWPCRIDGDLPTVLANIAGGSPDVIAALLDELVKSETASIDAGGRVFNRRMVRAHNLSEERAAAGRAGAEARWQTHGKHHGKRDGKTGEAEFPLSGGNTRAKRRGEEPDGCDNDGKPMASSSFGASSRENLTEDRGPRGKRATTPKERTKRTKLPEGWGLEPDLRAWTVDTLAATHATDRLSIERELEQFTNHHTAKGNTMADWRAAWRTWIWNAIKWSKNNGNNPKSPNGTGKVGAGTRAAIGYAIYTGAGASREQREPRDMGSAEVPDGPGDAEDGPKRD